jgi:hypothetical protein
MKPVVAWIRASLLATIVLATGTATAMDGGPNTGGKTCTDSNDCTQSAGHCHPTRHECVECLSARNCSTGLVCTPEGVCTECGSDADCPMNSPYCAAGSCIECRTDANCGSEGVVCAGGVCGSCGDGICHRSELIFDSIDFREVTGCPEDCASQCPTLTLNVNEVRTVSLTRNLFQFNCTGLSDLNDIAVAFTAPKGFYYLLRMTPDVSGAFMSLSERSDCLGEDRGCSYGDLTSHLFIGTAGQSQMFVIESQTARSVELEITEYGPICDNAPGEPVPEGCEITEPPADAGKPPEEQTVECLSHANDRGDPTCAGVTCACTECPRVYDSCGEAEGCTDVVQCMHDKGCIGVDCYTSGACRRLVDSQGGVSGPAFRAATALQACTLSHLCTLPCAEADAGATSPPDAGPLCTPGRRVACSCEGGASGTRRCNESGASFTECVCSSPEVPEPASCDCNLGRRASSGGVALLLFGLIAGLAVRRGGHASRRYR